MPEHSAAVAREATSAGHGGADERKSLDQQCLYLTRPALAKERVQCNVAGQVVLQFKTPWRNCTATHLIMSAREFMHRPAALRPRRAVSPYGLQRDSRLSDCFTAKNPGR